MNALLERLLGGGYMPHGHCYQWDPFLLWLHVGSDLLIAGAYYSIPLALVKLARTRPDLGFSRVFMLFAAFILACGTGHIFDVITVWRPLYDIDGMIKFATAGVSVATAWFLWPTLPTLMSLPSAAQLDEANERLRQEIDVRRRVEEELLRFNESLEDRLREHASDLNQILEALPIGVLMTDERGLIVHANPQLARIFGYTDRELLGKSVEQLVPKRSRSTHVMLRERFFAAPELRAMGAGRDLQGLRKDGSEVPVEVALNPIRSGANTRVLSSVIEITERKRTMERFNAQQEKLARSNAALEEFAYIASHDLKEPLRGIHNYASFLREDCAEKLDAPAQEKLDTLMRLTQRMNSFIDALLEYSRVGMTEEAIGPTDIDGILHEVLDTIAPLLEQHRIELRVNGPFPRVICDHVRVGEVFRNLITNAIKYRSATQPWIEIGWTAPKHEAQPGQEPSEADSWPVFHVKDNGIGIPQQHFQVIFRIFKRLHAREACGGGVGAGLSIVKRIVERHNGTIRVDSTVGEGSKFSFTIGPPASSTAG